MKASNLKDIRADLKNSTQEELLELTLKLIRFKKENKELISYLLYESDNDFLFIENCKEEMDIAFSQLNSSSFYLIKKGIRKILSTTKKHIRYAQKKEIEIELLLHFCKSVLGFKPSVSKQKIIMNTFETQIKMIRKGITTLEEDLQHDYSVLLEEVLNS